MLDDICPICSARCRFGMAGHRCNPRRLAKIDAAHRRATDDDLPDEPDDDTKQAEWAERMRALDDNYHPAEDIVVPAGSRLPSEWRR